MGRVGSPGVGIGQSPRPDRLVLQHKDAWGPARYRPLLSATNWNTYQKSWRQTRDYRTGLKNSGAASPAAYHEHKANVEHVRRVLHDWAQEAQFMLQLFKLSQWRKQTGQGIHMQPAPRAEDIMKGDHALMMFRVSHVCGGRRGGRDL